MGINGYQPNCASLAASFRYDALDRRIQKTINGRTIQYLYDGNDIVQEIENGVVKVNYIRTLNIDEPLARIEADGTVRYYLTDALGSIIAMADEAGVIVTQYAYEPFGNVVISGEASDNPFQYTGRENDGSGLYYYRARYYNPELQRFVSEDPIGFKSGDVNFYSYGRNNPINNRDAKGLTASSLSDCTNGSDICDKFGPCDTFWGANARCFCKCAGNDAWSQIVRCCLRGAIDHGMTGDQAHKYCYAMATAIAGPPPVSRLSYCYGLCKVW